MNYRRMGKSGLQLSELSFGSWVTFKNQLDVKKAKALMGYAYDQGVNFFDNAEVYAKGGAEEMMGKVIKSLGWSRDTYCISSKVFWGGDKPTQNGLSRKHVIEACHASLKRFKVDYLDLYYCHRPDPMTPIEETVHAMTDLVRQGKVLYWGTSEWNADQITEAYQVAKADKAVAPSVEQPQYNLFHREKIEKDFLPLYKNFGLGTTIWSPLASGLLTGKYNHKAPKDTRLSLPAFAWLRQELQTPEGKTKIEKATQLEALAKDCGTTLTKLSLAWCLYNKHVSSVILGASSLEQLKENLDIAQAQKALTPEVALKIESIVHTKP